MFNFGKKKKDDKRETIEDFDKEAYLEANLDVKEAIENGSFKDASHHLEMFGFDEIKKGDRQFHKDLEPFFEKIYLERFPEVHNLMKNREVSSAFDHFCKEGYSKLLKSLHNEDIDTSSEDIVKEACPVNNPSEEIYLEKNLPASQTLEEIVYDEKFNTILECNAFDKDYYLENNEDVANAQEDLLTHYFYQGWKEGRKPNSWFDPLFYFEKYDDVKLSHLDPLTHFLSIGHFEGREAAQQEGSVSVIPQCVVESFDASYYLENNPDIRDAKLDPLEHYYYQGWREGRQPNDWFEPVYYIKTYQDIKDLDIEPLQHYLEAGKEEGREPALKLKVDKSQFFNYLNQQTTKGSYHKDSVAYKTYDKHAIDMKLIAFYLPQYHPIKENDKAWGKGFTEWTNVSKALPQFDEHYQPRLPGELGHYDLRLLDVQKRQIELAKNYGLHGFCYHYYWFNGKKVLEKPLEQLLAHPELDFPFCVNWANENWTKKWDGLDNDVILYQEYSKKDDLDFIKDVSRMFKDPRYIHIDGKPLLMIYRPAHFPDIEKTVKRWRKWCLKNGIGEIYLMMTHSFEQINPNDVGFDGATEFYPNSIPVQSIKEDLTFFNEHYEGLVYDYKELKEISNSFQTPDYDKYRSLCPSWDNEARKPGKGTTYHNATPTLYQEWLENLCRYTEKNFDKEKRLIFINAWNEWGEGAYLEPDQKFGYGYLNATRQALLNYKSKKKKIIYVSHDAHFHGAQLLSLNIIRVLHDMFKLDVQMILKTGGELENKYSNYATVYNLEKDYASEEEKIALFKSLYNEGAENAICNTIVSGDILSLLSSVGLKTISLIHELPTLIKNYNMEGNAALIAESADHVIFPSTFVKNGFETITELKKKKAVVSPQGLYQVNRYQDHIEDARSELRAMLHLDSDAKIILGTGFADHRKGIDIFIEVALKVARQMDNTHFVWVGNVEQTMQQYIAETFELENANIIFVPAQPEIAVYYSGADLYLMTSREDPFPSVVMEAMNVKVPVIGFKNAGGFQDIVTEETGILVEYENDEAMTSAVVELLQDDKRRASLGEVSSTLIREKFIWKDYIYTLLDLVGMPYKKVSVVVPNYNYEQYIEARLKTVESQNYPVYELLYLEDCSPDNSLEVAKEFMSQTKSEMVIIENKINSGSVFKQWAKGIGLAKGDYVWIAEADDLADPDFLPEVMKGFDDPEVVVSYAQSKQIDQDDKLINETYLDYTNDISTDKWLSDYIRDGKEELADTLVVKNTLPNVSGVVFKKYDMSPILDKLLTFKVGGDWYFYYWLLQKGKLSFVAKSLNMHRRHTNSVTVSPENDKKHYQEIVDMQKLIRKNMNVSDDIWAGVKVYRKQVKKYLGIE